MITCLLAEFSKRFYDFSVIEKDIKLFTALFSVDMSDVDERMQMEVI